jgi:hypothetical protein
VQRTAEPTFSRPPVDVSTSDDLASTVRSRRALIAIELAPGLAAFTSAAAPATCGVAIEVPLHQS